MCLAAFSVLFNSDWPRVIIANRDEEHARPATTMQPWPGHPHILAGRDLRAGGTWLGVDNKGRMGLLTNYREPGNQRADAPTRGHLVDEFLQQSASAQDYLDTLQSTADAYNGFNLLLSDDTGCHYASNRLPDWQKTVPRGVHGLSNALLDTPWPKLVRTREALANVLSQTTCRHSDDVHLPELLDALTDIMQDRETAPDETLPRTGVSLELERTLSSPFITGENYGTRCTTVILQHRDGSLIARETSYSPNGQISDVCTWRTHGHSVWQPIHSATA